MRRLDTAAADFDSALAQLTAWEEASDLAVSQTVAAIISEVARRGDAALLEYTAQFDKLDVDSVAQLEVSRERQLYALNAIEPRQREALEYAAQRIRSFHQHQLQHSWQYSDETGNLLGQQITALERVGIYVPGGKASYPSSVLMNALPAKVAGVDEVVMVVPAPGGELNDLVLAAASIAGVDRIITIGGAQAIAALAHGTATVPAVDKIVGPGNIYVATAKRQVFGRVGIDMVAGPSEILIICDGQTDPDWVAMDLFSQAEHLLPLVRHAGAIFMGPFTSESLGDYCAGPNHVLPTSRSARFSSPLGVYDFQKRSSIIMCGERGVQELGVNASVLARGESLTAHARSAEMRLKPGN